MTYPENNPNRSRTDRGRNGAWLGALIAVIVIIGALYFVGERHSPTSKWSGATTTATNHTGDTGVTNPHP